MWLFDRIFRQPATTNVLPEENLATEIIAFFLDKFAPLRSQFFEEIKLKDQTGVWIVETQKHLYEPGQEWHGMIPDIALTSSNQRCKVIIEVKIDHEPTLDKKGRPQTLAYSEYLEHEKQKGVAETRLIALTRWLPDASFAQPCNHIFRFNDLLSWIEKAIDGQEGDPVLSAMVTKWGEYIKDQRWTMKPITTQHLEAIPKITDLVIQLTDVLNAARNALIEGEDRWQEKKGRSSAGQSLIRERKGEIEWTRPIGREEVSGDSHVQLGCFYGEEDRKIVIRPVISVSEPYLDRLSPEVASKSERSWWSDDVKLIWLQDVAPDVGRNNEVWDCMRKNIIRALKLMK